MHIQVKASNPGHNGAWRAGRHFTNGELIRMEVVEKADAVDANGNGPLGEDGRPSMTVIDAAGVEKLKGDGRLSLLSDGVGGGVSAEVLEGVRRQASAAASELSNAKADILKLQAQNKALTEENATLKAMVEQATAPAAEAAPAPESEAKGSKKK